MNNYHAFSDAEVAALWRVIAAAEQRLIRCQLAGLLSSSGKPAATKVTRALSVAMR